MQKLFLLILEPVPVFVVHHVLIHSHVDLYKCGLLISACIVRIVIDFSENCLEALVLNFLLARHFGTFHFSLAFFVQHQ